MSAVDNIKREAERPQPAPIEIPFSDACNLLELLRLTPIYALLGSQFEEEELGTEPDFKPHKWQGYEKDHADECIAAYGILLAGMQEQVDARGEATV